MKDTNSKGNENMKDIFAELCKRPRPAGSKRIKEVRNYIISILKRHSYVVEQKRYPFTGWELLGKPSFSFIRPVRKTVDCIPVVWSGSTEKELVGRIVPAFNTIKTFEAYSWQLYSVVDDKNRIVANVMTRPDMVWAQPLDDCTPTIPHLILDLEACKFINSWIVEGREIDIKMRVTSRYVPNKEIANIIATSNHEASGVVVSTHYDSMFNTVGAHDNASGTVALLKLTEFFSTKNSEYLRFIFFDAEEWNKYGSYCYVDELKQMGSFNRIKLVVNIDSVGVGDHVYFLTSPSIESHVRRIVGTLDNSSEVRVEVTSRKEFPQFDSWPFMRNGVPAINIGTTGTPSFPYFHHPKDDMRNVSYSLMEKVIRLLKVFMEALLEEPKLTGG